MSFFQLRFLQDRFSSSSSVNVVLPIPASFLTLLLKYIYIVLCPLCVNDDLATAGKFQMEVTACEKSLEERHRKFCLLVNILKCRQKWGNESPFLSVNLYICLLIYFYFAQGK